MKKDKEKYLKNKLKKRKKESLKTSLIAIFMIALFLLVAFLIGKKVFGKNSMDKNEKIIEKSSDLKNDEKETTIDEEDEEDEEKSGKLDPEEQEKKLTNEEKEKILSSLPEELKYMAETYPETVDFALKYEDRELDPSTINIENDLVEGEVPHFLQWDERWGFMEYNESFISTAACGPTVMSMIYTGLTGDTSKNPYEMSKFAEEAGYAVYNNGTAWDFFTSGPSSLGLKSEHIPLVDSIMKSKLDEGALIVANVGPGDFTTVGHYILIDGYEDKGYSVKDSNSVKNTEQLWPYEVLEGQIRGLWSISK